MSKNLKSENIETGSDISSASYVLEREIEGLQALLDSLDDTFSKAIELIHNTNGRVILSGMGKSGHVARKIAATLASTGTPALFVHPGEASHGDLGMVTKEDTVILLSNSGETKELTDIIEYTKRFSIPLIGIVRKDSSTLVESSDIAFILPSIPEASPLGAPTTSTTMMMALGDAIAVALLERNGFSKDDFTIFHPGGKLGSGLLKVDQIMKTGDELPIVSDNSPMSDAVLEISSKRMGCVGVVDVDKKLVGVITDGDLRRHMDDNIMNKKTLDVMTTDPKTIVPGALAVEAVQKMNDYSITSLFVAEAGTVTGIIHIHDLLRTGVA